ncbi:MAG: hypothetical protein ACPL4I_12915 [Bacteroidota bacterium]
MLPEVIYFPDGRSVCVRTYVSNCPMLRCVVWSDEFRYYSIVNMSSVASAVGLYLREKKLDRRVKSLKVDEEYVMGDGEMAVKDYKITVELADGTKMEINAHASRSLSIMP